MSLDILRKKNEEICDISNQQEIADIVYANKIQPTVTYLKARNLLPFFYRCLNDKEKQVKSCAVLAIRNFGP